LASTEEGLSRVAVAQKIACFQRRLIQIPLLPLMEVLSCHEKPFKSKGVPFSEKKVFYISRLLSEVHEM